MRSTSRQFEQELNFKHALKPTAASGRRWTHPLRLSKTALLCSPRGCREEELHRTRWAYRGAKLSKSNSLSRRHWKNLSEATTGFSGLSFLGTCEKHPQAWFWESPGDDLGHPFVIWCCGQRKGLCVHHLQPSVSTVYLPGFGRLRLLWMLILCEVGILFC